jgi:hypothetical protein
VRAAWLLLRCCWAGLLLVLGRSRLASRSRALPPARRSLRRADPTRPVPPLPRARRWRYATGEDREAATKVTRQLTDEEKAKMEQAFVIDGIKRKVDKVR